MGIAKVFNSKWRKQLELFISERSRKSKEEVIELLTKEGYDANIARRVVNFIINYIPDIEDFPIYSNDDIVSDYGIDDEDLGDFYYKTLAELRISIPSKKDQQVFFQKESRYTVGLAIRFLEWCKNRD